MSCHLSFIHLTGISVSIQRPYVLLSIHKSDLRFDFVTILVIICSVSYEKRIIKNP